MGAIEVQLATRLRLLSPADHTEVEERANALRRRVPGR